MTMTCLSSAATPLYMIAADLSAIADLLLESGGELTPEIEAQLAALEGAFEAKTERVALVVRNLMALAEAASVEARRLAELARVREAAARRLKEYLKTQMELAGLTKVETPLVVARIQKNGRPSIAWNDSDPESIPADYRRVTVSLDGEKALAAYKAGTLPDTFTVVVGTHLRLA
jgi:hypothetical protein